MEWKILHKRMLFSTQIMIWTHKCYICCHKMHANQMYVLCLAFVNIIFLCKLRTLQPNECNSCGHSTVAYNAILRQRWKLRRLQALQFERQRFQIPQINIDVIDGTLRMLSMYSPNMKGDKIHSRFIARCSVPEPVCAMCVVNRMENMQTYIINFIAFPEKVARVGT